MFRSPPFIFIYHLFFLTTCAQPSDGNAGTPVLAPCRTISPWHSELGRTSPSVGKGDVQGGQRAEPS